VAWRRGAVCVCVSDPLARKDFGGGVTGAAALRFRSATTPALRRRALARTQHRVRGASTCLLKRARLRVPAILALAAWRRGFHHICGYHCAVVQRNLTAFARGVGNNSAP